MQNLAAELEQEQAYVSTYRRLDTLRERAQAELERALRDDGGGNVQVRVDRDAFVSRYSGRLAQLAAAEDGLCSGGWTAPTAATSTSAAWACSTRTGSCCWSTGAPAAQPTTGHLGRPRRGGPPPAPAHPRPRRPGHRGRRARPGGLSEAERDGLSGEAALLAALTASRTAA